MLGLYLYNIILFKVGISLRFTTIQILKSIFVQNYCKKINFHLCHHQDNKGMFLK